MGVSGRGQPTDPVSYRPVTLSIPEVLRPLAEVEGPRVAAFDADGVLWHGDVSEDFTRWMIEQGHFARDLWSRYEATNSADPARGCLAILEFYAGFERGRLTELVAEFWRTAPERPWIWPVIDTVRWLAGEGYSIYVVSGTPAPVLAPLVDHMPGGVAAQVLALELEFEASEGGERATGRSTGIPTVAEGKAERLRAATSEPIALAVGNSVLDVAMLKLSDRFRWAVDPDDTLREQAESHGWLITGEMENMR